MYKTVLWISLCLLLFLSAGCTRSPAASDGPEESITVVTTIFPLADIIKQLGGERVSVSYLLPAGASPHTYEPTVEQAKLVARARLFVSVGAGLDDWAVKLAEAGGAARPCPGKAVRLPAYAGYGLLL